MPKSKPVRSFDLAADSLLAYSSSAMATWLNDRGLQFSACKILLDHEVDGLAFFMFNENDLKELEFTKVGLRKRLLCLASLWRQAVFNNSEKSIPSLEFASSIESPLSKLRCHDEVSITPSCSSLLVSANKAKGQPEKASLHTLFKCRPTNEAKVESYTKHWKVLASGLYAFLVFGLSSFAMVLAHERLPDISKYPPLPDILLDNLPHIPWAFKAAEVVCILLLSTWVVILVFHRFRFILIRRYFSLMGTVFLLRTITMIITSLSAPGQHLAEQCKAQSYRTLGEKLNRVMEIWFGLGMSLKGVVTCGDYMFSGHTTCLTLLNFFITEYTPRTFHLLHTFSWVLNIFGVFFILAAHEHYSIDVFIACYISSRLFLYYHCLANNNSLMHRDKNRTRIWFPLFSFFESDVCGVVPNKYEIPLRDSFKYLSNLFNLSRRHCKSLKFLTFFDSQNLHHHPKH